MKPEAVSGNTDFIENLTGPGRLNDTETRFGIGGTDVGIMWDNGIPDNPATPDVNEHQVLVAFGDTFRDDIPVRTTGWRMNTLFRSWDNTLSNGCTCATVYRTIRSYSEVTDEATPSSSRNKSSTNRGYAVVPSSDDTSRTAAISVTYTDTLTWQQAQYVQFMSVRSWDTPGQWTTNYSGIAYSDDNGQQPGGCNLVPASSIRTAAAGRSTVPAWSFPATRTSSRARSSSRLRVHRKPLRAGCIRMALRRDARARRVSVAGQSGPDP